MTLKNEKRNMIFAGLVIGVIASLLVLFGNPEEHGLLRRLLPARHGGRRWAFTRRRPCSTSGPRSSVWCFGSFFMALCQEGIFSRAAAARP